jgi:hypothetical protein
MVRQQRMVTTNWDLYDTRHVVYQPISMSPEELKRGYDWSYEAFYEWNSIFKAASAHQRRKHQLKHFFYSAGWKKFERAWDFVIRVKQLSQMRPILEAVLSPVGLSSSSVREHETVRNTDVKCGNPHGRRSRSIQQYLQPNHVQSN